MAAHTSNKSKSSASFSVLISGEIETAEFLTAESIYCKYVYVYGPDWTQVSGIEEGISATAQRCSKSHQIVLNTPLEATFTSTNPFKWPQIVLSCYGPDRFGNDVIRGYGATFLPSTPGKTVRKVPLFVPQASTTLQEIIGFFTGRYAEFVDPRIVSMAEGREVTRVSTRGYVTLILSTMFRDTKKFGFDLQPQSITKISDFPLPNFEELGQQQNLLNTINDTQGTQKKLEESPTNDYPSPRGIQTIDEEELKDEESVKTSTD